MVSFKKYFLRIKTMELLKERDQTHPNHPQLRTFYSHKVETKAKVIQYIIVLDMLEMVQQS